MPTIAIISNNAFSVVNFRSHLIKDLIEAGCSVYVLAPDYTAKEKKELQAIGAQPVDFYMERTGQNPVNDMRSVYSLVKTLKSIGTLDITFSYGIKPVVYGLWASALAGIQHRYAMVAGLGTLYVEREQETIKEKGSRILANGLYKASLPFAHKVFFQNPDDIDLFVNQNIIHEDKPRLLNGSGVNVSLYHTEHNQKDPVTFMLVSRLIKEKGVYEFVEVARRMKKIYPEERTRFILLGDVDANPSSVSTSELESWVDEGILEWPGHVDDVKAWLEQTSVFVLPTYYREGTPKSILEAMSMGRPIITTDMPGCREAVTDGENGFLISPRDVPALQDAVQEFIETPRLIETMGKESRRIAVERYDVRKVNEVLLREMALV